LWTPAVDNSHVYSYAFNLTVSDPVTGAVQATIADPNSQDFDYFADGSAVPDIVVGINGSPPAVYKSVR